MRFDTRPGDVFPADGDHFAAWQGPELLTTEVRAAFRSLRTERRSS